MQTRKLKMFFKNHFDDNHSNIAGTMEELGNAWGESGNYEKQRDLFTQAFPIIEMFVF